MGTGGPFIEVYLISVTDLNMRAEDDDGNIGGLQVVQTCWISFCVELCRINLKWLHSKQVK